MRDCFCWSSDLNDVEVSERRVDIAEGRKGLVMGRVGDRQGMG